MSGFSRNGESYFVSYRDPNLAETDRVYEGIPEYLRGFTVEERDMTKYIIGTVSDMDIPKNPAAKGARSLAAYMTNVSYEMLQRAVSYTHPDVYKRQGLYGSERPGRDTLGSELRQGDCVLWHSAADGGRSQTERGGSAETARTAG